VAVAKQQECRIQLWLFRTFNILVLVTKEKSEATSLQSSLLGLLLFLEPKQKLRFFSTNREISLGFVQQLSTEVIDLSLMFLKYGGSTGGLSEFE